MVSDLKLSVSEKFKDSPDNIIASILTEKYESNKKLEFESSGADLEFISNFWKPSEIVDYVNKHHGKASDYLFFENRLGFHYKTLNKMMSETKTHILKMEDTQKTLYDPNYIQQFQMNKYFNIIEFLKSGAMGNTLYDVNSDFYEFDKHVTDLKEIEKYSSSLGKSLSYPDDLITSNNIISSHNSSDKLSLRQQMLKSMMNYHLVLKLTGDLSKTIGQVYEIQFRSLVKDKFEFNKILAGNWFCTNINHEILNNGKFTQNIKVIKNSLFEHKTFSGTSGKKNL
jgi:hypothetical protein